MAGMFHTATRKKKKLRLLLAGPTDAGKTRTALRFAFGIVAHELKLAGINRPPKIWAIDTEHGRLSFYKNLADDGIPYIFDVCELEHFKPQTAVLALKEGWSAGIDAMIVDSISHFWNGAGGTLEQHREFTERRKDKNSYAAWSESTSIQNQFIEALLRSPFHVIATCRQKMDAVQEPDPTRPGKTIIRSIGLQDEQRDTVRYEFDVIANISQDHELTIVKKPWDAMDCGPAIKPGAAFITPLIDWLNEGEGDFDKPSFPEPSIPETEQPAAKTRGGAPKAPALNAAGAAAAGTTTAGAAAAGPTFPPAGNGVSPGVVQGSEKQAVTTQAVTTQATTTATTTSQPNTLQASEIYTSFLALADSNEITAREKLAAALQKRGVATIEQLTKEQAAEIVENLRKAILKKKADLDKQLSASEKATAAATGATHSAADIPTTTTAPDTSTAATGIPADPDKVGSIDKADESCILQYVKRLSIDDPALKKILAKRTTQAGNPVHSIPDLSFNQGREMLEKLRAKCIEMQGDDIPF